MGFKGVKIILAFSWWDNVFKTHDSSYTSHISRFATQSTLLGSGRGGQLTYSHFTLGRSLNLCSQELNSRLQRDSNLGPRDPNPGALTTRPQPHPVAYHDSDTGKTEKQRTTKILKIVILS